MCPPSLLPQQCRVSRPTVSSATALISCLALLILPNAALGFHTSITRTIDVRQKPKFQRKFQHYATPSTTTTTTTDKRADDVVDVCICGAGPAGLLLASSLARSGCSVRVVDPALDKPWPNNYGVWMDEVCYFGYEDCIDHVWKEAGVIYDEDTPEQILERPYGRVDRKAMKARLLQECRDAVGDVTFTTAKATDLQHYDTQPAQVTLQQESNNESKNNNLVNALMVVDATGFSRKFVKHDVEFDPGYQVTYGARFRVQDLGPYQLDRMVLMDYCERHLYGDDELVQSNIRFPTFLYAMPLAEDELFLEETILVSRPGGSSRNLQARMEKRMQALNITALEVLEEERAAIPMGGADPAVPQRTIGFGATSSLVHPASGYMVARAMEVAPRVAQQMTPQIEALRKQYRDGTLSADSFDEASEETWKAVWPADERRQRDFMHFGFELLCRLNPQELRDFFTGFFRLPNGLWEHFLSWRLSGVGHIVMGVTVWATCIPKRFMPTMLINSLPFLANKLVLPFATRGDPLFTDSVYWDARSNNSTIWEPETFFPFLKELASASYPGKEYKDKSSASHANGSAKAMQPAQPEQEDRVKEATH